ncbi:aspartate aminotransferase family protein [Thioclava sp. FR2]|uniref:aspartate aminotransferase family protein n=1 Tax=Thioclava sp. FR2 TaxID=3445780 RepID=UPI003EBB6C5E
MIEDLNERRARLMGPNVPTFYRKPVHIVRGEGVWLWDADGKRYLDCYNNVAHVGHCHPKVVEAICKQAATLNTHTRYHHELVLNYIEELTSTLGHGISQAIMVCTGSEANDLALRMAQAKTGKTGIIATDNTYHGNTAAVSQLSTRRPPIGGRAPNVRLVPAPETTRPLGGSLQAQAQAFAQNVAKAIQELEDAGYGFSGLMICPVFANEGLLAPVRGFLDATVEVVRRAGGLILCDEVQPGFGRVGSHFWGHDALGFAPDVVTIGKPMANGHPVAACLARPDIMSAFRDLFGYFNTFGGNPVSAAACLATLHVIKEEGLQEAAADTSSYLLERLNALAHPNITNARAAGMFFGLEFDGERAEELVADLVEDMVDRGFLLNRIGRGGRTLKMRPPMPFGKEHADLLADALEAALAIR